MERKAGSHARTVSSGNRRARTHGAGIIRVSAALASNRTRVLVTMASKTPAELISARLKGLAVSHVVADGGRRLAVHFVDGTILVVEAPADGLVARVESAGPRPPGPTKRQYEYLAFIAKYIARFGRPPAESDIERHFLVSAPSVNQMMQTLERRGFISRKPGVPRSIRILVRLSAVDADDARDRP
jgi:LexA DNA binding domain